MDIKELIESMRSFAEDSRTLNPKSKSADWFNETAAALLAQQVVIEKMRTHLRELHKWEQGSPLEAIIGKALTLQPDLTALREHEALVVEKFAAYVDDLANQGVSVVKEAKAYAERIRKGEA